MAKTDFEQMLNSYIAYVGGDIEYDPEVVSIDPTGELPILEPATIRIPGKKPIKTKIVTVTKKYKPKYKLKKPEFYLKMYAYDNVVNWSVRLIEDIDNIKAKIKILKDPDSSEEDIDQARTIRRDIDLLFSDAHQWYGAVSSRGFSNMVRKEIRKNIDKDLRDTIRKLRNIMEHWAQNQLYFFGKGLEKDNRDTKSVRWYIEKYPDCDPWVLAFPAADEEPLIASVFRLSRFEREFNKIIRIIKNSVEERVLFGNLKAKT